MTESQRLFTLQDVENTSKHTMIHADNKKAEELIKSGAAVKLDMPELNKFEKKANEIYGKYQRDVDEIRASDNPLMTEQVKKYEINKLEEQMRKQSAEVEREYKEWQAQQQAEARERAAKAVINVGKEDEAVAEQMVTRYSLQLAAASDDDDKGVIANQLLRDIKYLDDAQKTAMQKAIAPLLGELDTLDRNKLINEVSDIRNADLLAEKVASQLPASVLNKQRMHDALKNVKL